MDDLNFFKLNGKKISKEDIISNNIELSKLSDNLKSKLSIFDSDSSGSLDTPEELNSFWKGLIEAVKANPNGDSEELEIDEIKEFLGKEDLEEAEAKDFAEFVLGFAKQETANDGEEIVNNPDSTVDKAASDKQEMAEGEEITRTSDDGTISTFKRSGDKIIETKSDEEGTLECVYDSTVLEDVSQENMSSSKFVSKDGTIYNVKYGKIGNTRYTVSFLANNDSPEKLAKKIERFKNGGKDGSPQDIYNTTQEILKLNSGNKYYVGEDVNLPGFYLANDPMIIGQGTREAALNNYDKATAKYNLEADLRKHNIQKYKNENIKTYKELAEYLYAMEGIKIESHVQIETRVRQLKELNDIEDGDLAGKQLKIALAPGVTLSATANVGNSVNSDWTSALNIDYFEKLDKKLKLCESKGVDCGDIRDLINVVKSKGLSNRINKEYFEYFKWKIDTRLKSVGKPRETLPKQKFKNLNFEQNPSSNDCWFLSTIGSLANDDVNRAKLEKMVKYDSAKNTVTVTLPSLKEPYVIPLSRLQGATEFSSGNLYVRALEMAAEKFLIERNNSIDIFKIGASEDVKSPFDGGTMRYASAILFDSKVDSTDYIDTSVVQQVYASLVDENNSNLILNEVFNSIGLDKKYQKKDAYDYYHSGKTISEALSSHKLVAAITTDLMNNDDQYGNHVCYVTNVTYKKNEKGSGTTAYITVRDPNGGTKEYTEERFKQKFPLVEIIAPEGEPDVAFKPGVANMINNIPMHYATKKPRALLADIMGLIDDSEVTNAIKTYQKIIGNEKVRKELRKELLTFMEKNVDFGTTHEAEIRTAIIVVITSPEIVKQLNAKQYNVIKRILKKEPVTVDDLYNSKFIDLFTLILANIDVERAVYRSVSDEVYDWMHENGLGDVNDSLYKVFTKPAVDIYKWFRGL